MKATVIATTGQERDLSILGSNRLEARDGSIVSGQSTGLATMRIWDQIRITMGRRCEHELLAIILLPLQQASGLGRPLNRMTKRQSKFFSSLKGL